MTARRDRGGPPSAPAAVGRRAIDDPAKLAKAARIIRLALERRRLRLAAVDSPKGNESEPGGTR